MAQAKTTNKKITLKAIRQWFDEEGFEPRHDIRGMKHAVNVMVRENDVDGMDMFLLVVENRPFGFTHSYGFHTATGRGLIEAFQNNYYKFVNNR